MIGRGDGQADGVHAVGKRFDAWQNVCTKLRGNLRCAGRVYVHYANKLGRFQLAINAHVVASKIADAYDSHADLLSVS
jgi:hypothetical protein